MITNKPKMKKELVASLKEKNARYLVFKYEGSGDEGQFEEVRAYLPGGNIEELSEYEITSKCEYQLDLDFNISGKIKEHRYDQKTGKWESSEVTGLMNVEEMLEEFAYNLLDDDFGGWADSDGSLGSIVIDLDTMAISMEHGVRYTDVDYHYVSSNVEMED